MKREVIKVQLDHMLQFGLASSTVTVDLGEETSLLREVGLDSVQIIELIVAIEKNFNLPVFDDELNAGLFDRYGNLIDYIYQKINGQV